jgi:hypothetical protein
MSKLTDMLDKYRKGPKAALKVGIMGDKTYPDGELVAYVGYVNEYGYKGMVPARKQTIYHSVNADGSMRNDGRFVKAKKANLERIVDVPSYELDIPSRPFFRTAIANNRDALKEIIAKAIKEGGVVYGMRIAGEFMSGALQESVMTWSDPPNAASTVAAKGYNAPLRANDKILRNSFTYEVEQ